MIAVLGMFVLYVVLQGLLVTAALAIGFGLHWFIPDLSIGIAVLVGMASSIACAYFLMQLTKIAHMGGFEDILLDDDEDESGSLHVALLPKAARRRPRSKKR